MAFQVISKNYLDTLMAEQLFLKILFGTTTSVFSNNLALYLKDLKTSSAISVLKFVASSLK